MQVYTHSKLKTLKMTFLFIWHMHTQEEKINTSDRRTVYRKRKGFKYTQAQEIYTRIGKLLCANMHKIKRQLSICACTWRERWLVYIHIR